MASASSYSPSCTTAPSSCPATTVTVALERTVRGDIRTFQTPRRGRTLVVVARRREGAAALPSGRPLMCQAGSGMHSVRYCPSYFSRTGARYGRSLVISRIPLSSRLPVVLVAYGWCHVVCHGGGVWSTGVRWGLRLVSLPSVLSLLPTQGHRGPLVAPACCTNTHTDSLSIYLSSLQDHTLITTCTIITITITITTITITLLPFPFSLLSPSLPFASRIDPTY